MPQFLAALASPPTARIQLPRRVRASMNAPASASTTHHTTTFGTPTASALPPSVPAITPARARLSNTPVSTWPLKSAENTTSFAASSRSTASPLVLMMVLPVSSTDTASDSPRSTKKKASVTMNDGSPVLTTT